MTGPTDPGQLSEVERKTLADAVHSERGYYTIKEAVEDILKARAETPTDTAELRVDPEREYFARGTGILVRAQDPEGKWGNADIVQLDTASLTAWLRSRGGKNEWAESVVRILLDHQ